MEIGAAVTAVKGALELARTAKNVNDRAQLNAAMSDIMDKLTTAKSEILELLTENQRLLEDNGELRQQLRKEERFNQYLMERTSQGYYILSLKEEFVSTNTPPHAICHVCREKGIKSILNELEDRYSCPVCNYIAWKVPPAPARRRSRNVVPSSLT